MFAQFLLSIAISLAAPADVVAGEAFSSRHQPERSGWGPDPGTPHELRMSNQESLPQDVQSDLNALNGAFELIPGGLEAIRWWSGSPDGTVVVAAKSTGRDAEEPTGVWIWPHWREADNVLHYEQFSRAQILSNHHVRLIHWAPQSSAHVRIVDLRHPDASFHFSGFATHMLRIADNDRWACLTTDGQLVSGFLCHADGDWMQHVAQIPLDDMPLKELAFLHGGDVLLIELEVEPGRRQVRSYVFPENDDPVHIDTIDGSIWGPRSTFGDVGIFGRATDRRNSDRMIAFMVDERGDITIKRVSFHAADERPSDRPSPSGKFVTTYSGGGLLPIRNHIRRTPLADPNEPIPPRPDASFGGGPGWLSW